MTKHPLFHLLPFLVLSALIQSACASARPASSTATSTLPATLPAITTLLPAVPIFTMPVVSSDAPTATQSVGGPQYVVINPPGGEYGNLQNSFIQTANALGADAQKYDDLYDANASISQVNNTIKAGARGIAIQSFAPLKTGPAVAKAAKTAGVVLVAIESPIMDANGKRVPLIRYDDDTEMGKKVGDAASKLLAEIGWLKDSTRKVGVLSLEVNSQPFCNIRTDNAKVAIKNAGIPDKQIFPLQYDVIKVDSQDTTGAILSAHPDITNWVVFSCTDSGIAGSLKAFAAAGVKTEDILGIGIGAYEACIPWAAGQPTGFKASLNISTQDMGKTAATLLNDMVVNSKIPPGRHNSLYNYRGCHELQDNHGSGFAS